MANHLARGCLTTLCRCTGLRKISLPRHGPSAAHTSVSTVSQSTASSASTDAIPPPHIEGSAKEYPTHIRSIVDEISKLNLLEVADLNELLKKTLNISDAPVMTMGAMPTAVAKEEEEEAPAAPTGPSLYSVKLVKFDDSKKVALIKEIKNLMTGMNLVQAKKFVESTPAEVRKDITKEEAETLQKALEAVGGTVSMDEMN